MANWWPRLGALLVILVSACLLPVSSAAQTPTTPPTRAVSAAPAALLMVMDLSGSMNDNDANGKNKLTGAKQSLSRIVGDTASSSTPLGLWTYPTAGSNCDPGSFLAGADGGVRKDTDTLMAQVSGLKADGGTPTGPALRASVDSLKANGITTATVVLISDGESNCGQAPCDTAKQIVAEGFDVTVEALGFQLSGQGRTELECIASTTGGRYSDIADVDEMQKRLKELMIPELALTISAPDTVAGGADVTLTANVTNSSARAVNDVRLSLSFRADTDQALFPVVIPPVARLGNIPAGHSANFEWKLRPADSNATQDRTANYRVIATAARPAAAAMAEGTIKIDLRSVAGGVVKALLDNGSTVAVFGDSYAAGEGAGRYLPGNSRVDEWCHRSQSTHVTQLFGIEHTKNYACSGAVQTNLFGPQPGRVTYDSQVAQMDDGPTVDAAFLSIGGNDIGFADIVTGCLYPNYDARLDTLDGVHLKETISTCGYADANAQGLVDNDAVRQRTVRQKLDDLSTQLPGTYRKVYDALNTKAELDQRDGSEAPLLVLGYPLPFPDTVGVTCGEFSAREVAYANKVVRELNRVLARSVSAAQNDARQIYWIDTVERSMQPVNTLCDGSASGINGATFGQGAGLAAQQFVGLNANKQELVHPNELGYSRIAGAIAQWSTSSYAAPHEAPSSARHH
ncbi:VWA domain-containing protein [Rhodococcus qingshengii]|jgi:Ca-activated chloride channel family protein|uniref:VWA domain-containing protein n=4 Tax=Actinomycetota TaxID=201174 RepID=UPI0001A22D4C|nr:VWA domain-containing protein [Rhodococcus qingshengii]EEN88370.1 von Willebrand factor type A domain protein [Rhodococcus erythropolis SK121]NHP18497.1 VWA domain-containing protein [Rhodococcus sp. IC4_135]OKA08550.1 hypothetical protein BS618_32185 [Rhodococcus erythropolis]MCZ4548068.1 GDSL-type esterase/lipase family protein [Rhodococcus qingshengii]REK80084.1 VWA domain-containing protein [Rhodococcus erythropolis]